MCIMMSIRSRHKDARVITLSTSRRAVVPECGFAVTELSIISLILTKNYSDAIKDRLPYVDPKWHDSE